MSHSANVSAFLRIADQTFVIGKLSPTVLTLHQSESRDASRLTGQQATIELIVDGKSHKSAVTITSVDVEKREIHVSGIDLDA